MVSYIRLELIDRDELSGSSAEDGYRLLEVGARPQIDAHRVCIDTELLNCCYVPDLEQTPVLTFRTYMTTTVSKRPYVLHSDPMKRSAEITRLQRFP